MTAGTSARVRLLHMRDEIESLSQELAGQSFETYWESYALRRITERAIQIVSEASRASLTPASALSRRALGRYHRHR